MKHLLSIITLALTSTAFFAQNINPQQQYQQPLPQTNVNQSNPPPVQQVVNYNLNVLNNENNQINNDNINWDQNPVNNVDEDNEQQGGNKFSSNVQQKEEKEPCPDCDKIKKAKRDNYGNNVAGNYSGGAQKFKRKKSWKRFCYNVSHHSGKKKMKSNYSMCFNW